MKNTNQKCELCSMIATHNEVDLNRVIHYFCQHHTLKHVKKGKINHAKLLPLFGIFVFIILLSIIRQLIHEVNLMQWMMDFMGVFFMVFGLFKLYDLKGFVQGFQVYDVITKKIPKFGYAYPFIEIFLGATYLAGCMIAWQTILTIILAVFGLYSAFKAIQSKNKIQCVCLGTFFNFPMTYVTILENGIMFAMALFMLLI